MRTYRRPITALVACAHLLLSTFLVVLPSHALAQVTDADPPLIEFEPIEQGVLGDSQVFSATITDDQSLEAVTLHYRFDADSVYTSEPMIALGGTSIYTASVDTAGTDASVLQYYLEARDEAGNRSIRGFAFDPLERTLTDEASIAPVAEGSPEVPEPGMSTGKKVLIGVLGVLVVGGIAAAAGGGGGSGSDVPSADDPNGVPVTITVDPIR